MQRPFEQNGGFTGNGHLPDDVLARPLSLSHYLLDGVQTLAVQLAELGAIDLPPILHPAADVSHLQAAAPLYLASELEAARLIPAVEILAALFAEGGLRLEAGNAARALYGFWQGRHNRFSRQEREAFFARLFGTRSGIRLAVEGDRNRVFESQMAALAETILDMEPDPVFGSRPVSDARVAIAAGHLAQSVVARSGGITAFAARDIVQTIEDALKILKLRPVQVALGALSVWTAVDAVARRYLNEAVNIRAHVQRGRSGMLLMTWVAEHLPSLEITTAAGNLQLTPSIYAAAASWLQATYEIQSSPTGDQTLLGSTRALRFPESGALTSAQG